MFKMIALLAAALGGVQLMNAGVDDGGTSTYRQEVEAWRSGRLQRLTAADGWLSLIGLHWLKEGVNRVGSAADNDIVLTAGPAHFGSVTLRRGRAAIELDPASGATIDAREQRTARLRDDARGRPTVIAAGSVSFYLVERNGRYGLRVKDSQAKTRTEFAGIEHFPVDPSWRIEARWVPLRPVGKLETPNVLGLSDVYPVPGKAVFERDGKTFELLPVIEVPGDKELFLIFADRTSGRETYGGARFLYAPMPKDGKIVLDFNKAYNPPCAFTPYATCPLAPPENRLDLAVTAGEKRYRGGAH